MKDFYDGIVEHETQVKLARVEAAWQEDPEKFKMLDDALDMIKQACDTNELPPMNSSEALSMGVELVEQTLLEKDAEAWEQVGNEVADLLKEAGVTEEDLAEVKTEEDEEAFGRFCARLWAGKRDGVDYLNQE
jgi:hypothetical protein